MNTLLIVAGGRDFDDVGMLNEALYRFPAILTSEFVNGMCKTGADLLAREYARKRGRKVHEFPADWDKYGKKAGPLRNGKMAQFVASGMREGNGVLRESAIHGVLIAFWDGRSPGTRSMINEALKKGLEVHVYRYSK